jgi:hypothetical protein
MPWAWAGARGLWVIKLFLFSFSDVRPAQARTHLLGYLVLPCPRNRLATLLPISFLFFLLFLFPFL